MTGSPVERRASLPAIELASVLSLMLRTLIRLATPAQRIVAALVLLLSLSAAPVPRPGQVLIARVKALVDSGRLADPALVAQTLHMRFDVRSQRSPSFEAQASYPIDCAIGLRRRDDLVNFYTPTSATALRPAPFGRALSAHGAAPIGSPPPVAVSDAPHLTYLIATEHDCTGYIRLNEETRAELQIGPLNSLDCISDEDLHAWLPAVQRGYATDGAEVSHYENRRAGLLASFDSAAGSPCLLSLSIRQEPRLIPRYQAAKQRQRACMVPHRIEFCRRHPPFGWGDGDVQSDMDSYAARACGTLDSFFAHTPVGAQPRDVSLAPEDPQHSTPCSRAEAELTALHR